MRSNTIWIIVGAVVIIGLLYWYFAGGTTEPAGVVETG